MSNSKSIRTVALSTVLLASLISGCGGENPEALVTSAKEFLAKNDTKGAIIQLKNALQQKPDSAEARFILGKALLEAGDAQGAEVELRKALGLKFSPDDIVPLLARSMLKQGQAQKVIDEFSKTTPSSALALADLKTSLSSAYQLVGKAEASLAALDQAVASQPDYYPALLASARLKASKQDLKGALEIVDQVLAKAPGNHEALLLKGALLAIQGNRSAALVAYREAIAAKPDYVLAHSAVISSLLQQSQTDEAAKALEALKKVAPKHPQSMYLETQLSFQKKDYKLAREQSQQLLKSASNAPNFLQIAGMVEYELRSFLQAENYLSKALQQAPDLILARRFLISTYLQSGQSAKALTALAPVLGKISNDPTMLTLAGQTYFQNGDLKKAEEFFASAAKLSPDDAQKRTSLALTHLAKGDLNTGFSELEQIAGSDRGISADMALISAYFQRNDFDKAIKAIEKLEAKQPDNPMTFNLKAKALLAKKDIPAARKNFEKALQLNPTFLPAANSLAALDLVAKKPEDARKRFESVLAADKKNVGALLALAELTSRTNGKPEDVQKLISQAVEGNPSDSAPRLALIEFHLRNKEPKKALSSAQEAVAAIPDKPELLDALGKTQQIDGNLNQALSTYGKLASSLPTSPVPYMRMADIYLADKNKDEAGKSLRKALEIKSDLLEAQKGLIYLALDAKNFKEAFSISREIQKQRPKAADGYILEGDIYRANKQLVEAIASYRNGLKQVPSTDLAIKLHSTLLAVNSANGEADKFAAAWQKDHSKDLAFQMHLADLALSRKDVASAIQRYRAILDAQPNNPLVLNNLAWALGQTGGSKAIEYAEKANQLAPNQPAYMDTLAMLLAEKGEHAKAIELLQKAVNIAPQAEALQLNLVKTLIRANRKDEAKAQLDLLAKQGVKSIPVAELDNLKKQLQ
ncbi:MAG: PEP-CTERM system TPR-repeat protein PrsT [Rhodocyclales bacterium GT-UBC]|nr:MAG: PEP-CTERM system TPR-repeat protein PrsT [Rhodocyclales bacterium GT-UBC]